MEGVSMTHFKAIAFQGEEDKKGERYQPLACLLIIVERASSLCCSENNDDITLLVKKSTYQDGGKLRVCVWFLTS